MKLSTDGYSNSQFVTEEIRASTILKKMPALTPTNEFAPPEPTLYSRESIFGRYGEIFFLALGILGIALSAIDVAWPGFKSYVWVLIPPLVFIDLHVAISVYAFFFLGEFRELARDPEYGGLGRFWGGYLAIGLLPLCIFAFFFSGFWGGLWGAPSLLLIQLSVILRFHHGAGQRYGFSQLYQGKFQATTGSVRANLRRMEKGLHILLWILFVPVAANYWPQDIINPFVILSGISRAHWRLASYLLSALSLLSIVLFLLALAYRFHAPIRKALFNARLALFSLICVTPLAAFFISTIHAAEYAQFFHLIHRNSRKKILPSIQNPAPLLTLVLFVAFIILSHWATLTFYFWPPKNIHTKFGTFFLLALYLRESLLYMHYYLDRKMFRFRRQAVQRHVIKLLSPLPETGT